MHRQTIRQGEDQGVVRRKTGRNQKTGNCNYHSDNGGTFDTQDKDQLAQRKGSAPTKYTRRGMLMRDW